MDDDARFEAACNAFDMLPAADRALFFKLADAKVYEYVTTNKIDAAGLRAHLQIGLHDNGELWILCDLMRDGEIVEEKVPLVRLLAFKSTPFVGQVAERVQ